MTIAAAAPVMSQNAALIAAVITFAIGLLLGILIGSSSK